MKAFILAAGLGTRMRPLTDTQPKPLLKAGGKALIEYHIERLVSQGIVQLVINTAYLGEKIESFLGNGQSYGATIEYSREGEPLETGGAIVHALPLLGNEPFIVVNGDIYTDFPFAHLLKQAPEFAHLVLVDNPGYKTQGDFNLVSGLLSNGPPRPYTYAGVGVYNPGAFRHKASGDAFALGPLLRERAEQQKVTGELYGGTWMDIGTPERLEKLNKQLTSSEL